MMINASTEAFLRNAQAMGIKPFHQSSPQECRAVFAALCASFGPGPDVGAVDDHSVAVADGTIGLRLFRPRHAARGVILYIHGGGWVMGTVADYDGFARRLVEASGWAVALVDYRLAPEHPFPTALEDCLAAASWLVNEQALHLSLVVAGDSAGGNLAAVVARRMASAFAAQVLLYPLVQAEVRYPSQADPACQMLLTQLDVDWFWDRYLPEAGQRSHPDASPLQAEDLRGLSPALVATAGHDPLHDEGADYAARLDAAGVPTVHRNYPEDTHGFATIPPLASSVQVLAEIASFLARFE